MRAWDAVVEQFIVGRLGDGGIASISGEPAQVGRDSQDIVKLLDQIAEVDHAGNPSETERRRYPRINTDERASMRLIAPMMLERIQVRIVNVSMGGLLIRMEHSLTPQTIIQLRVRNTFVLGEVRHAIRKDDGWYVGVKVQDLFASPH